jgi:DNA-binding transcriptional MerR regulator
MPEADDEHVIAAPELTAEAGITYRQLDFWTREGLLRCSWRQGGRYRVWDAGERQVAVLIGRLVGAGIAPRTAAKMARAEGGRCEIAPGIWIQVGDSAAIEWGVRFEIGGVNEVPRPSEEDARTVVASLRENRAEFGAELIVRTPEVPAGPWRLADDPPTGETRPDDGNR